MPKYKHFKSDRFEKDIYVYHLGNSMYCVGDEPNRVNIYDSFIVSAFLLVYVICRAVGICEIFKGGQLRIVRYPRDLNIADRFGSFILFFFRKLAVRQDGN